MKALLTGLFTFMMVAIAGIASAQSHRLPELGDASGGVLTSSEEMELGRSLLREVRRVLLTIEDPEVVFYLDSLGQRLVSHATDAAGPFHFVAVDNGQVNAFAMPGGIVGVYHGLLLETRDEAELAAVLAHEIAHVTQRHIARMFARGRDINFTTGLAILAGILAAGIDPQLGQAVITGGIAAGIQSQIDYTRANEAEADRVGIQILASSGFDPQAMADFFQRLQDLSRGTQDSIPEYLRTHPVTLGRISDARNRAEQMSGDFRRDGTGDFAWIQARVRAVTDPRRSVQRHEAARSRDPLLTYEAFVAHLILGDTAAASRLLAQLPDRGIPPLTRALAEVQLRERQGEYATALALLVRLDSVYPGHPVVRHLQARIQHESGAHRDAVRTVDQLLRGQTTPDPGLLRLKAEAADAAGMLATSREAMAEYFFHRGQYAEAVRQFDDALAARDTTTRDIERIEHKRDTARQVARDVQR